MKTATIQIKNYKTMLAWWQPPSPCTLEAEAGGSAGRFPGQPSLRQLEPQPALQPCELEPQMQKHTLPHGAATPEAWTRAGKAGASAAFLEYKVTLT